MNIVSNASPFQQARIKLSFWYSISIVTLLAVFTVLVFSARQSSFVRVYQVVDNTTENPQELADFQDQFDAFDQTFRSRIITIDFIIAATGTIFSYWLSGITLKPIKRMMEQQQAFAADASHELRTPLATMKMEVESTLRTTKRLPKNIKHTMLSLKEELDYMTAIVQGLLNLVRLDVSDGAIDRQRFTVKELLNKVQKQMLPQAKSKGHILKVRSRSKATLYADIHQIMQILVILVDNAIKHSGKNNTISLHAKKHKEYIKITINDDGKGIPNDSLDKIFDRYYQIKPNSTGSGLGLSIAKSIARTHEGDIQVVSQKGVGTTFTLTLPLK